MTKQASTIYAEGSRNESIRLVKFDSINKTRSELVTASSRIQSNQNSNYSSPVRKGGMTIGNDQPRCVESRDSVYDKPVREYNR